MKDYYVLHTGTSHGNWTAVPARSPEEAEQTLRHYLDTHQHTACSIETVKASDPLGDGSIIARLVDNEIEVPEVKEA